MSIQNDDELIYYSQKYPKIKIGYLNKGIFITECLECAHIKYVDKLFDLSGNGCFCPSKCHRQVQNRKEAKKDNR